MKISGVVLGSVEEQAASGKGYVIPPDAVVGIAGDEWVPLTDNFDREAPPIGRVRLRADDGRVIADGEIYGAVPDGKQLLALGVQAKMLPRDEEGRPEPVVVEVYRVTGVAVCAENKDPSIGPYSVGTSL